METQLVDIAGRQLRIPTLPEALRVKAYLVVQRNFVRDYLDVAALTDRLGISEAGAVLETIDEYDDDRSADDESVVTALVPRLADPAPRDHRTLADLPRYKGLSGRWHDWAETRRVCSDLAQSILNGTRHV